MLWRKIKRESAVWQDGQRYSLTEKWSVSCRYLRWKAFQAGGTASTVKAHPNVSGIQTVSSREMLRSWHSGGVSRRAASCAIQVCSSPGCSLVPLAVDVCTAFYIDGHDSESCGWAGISRIVSGILGVFLFSASFISLVGLGKPWWYKTHHLLTCWDGNANHISASLTLPSLPPLPSLLHTLQAPLWEQGWVGNG